MVFSSAIFLFVFLPLFLAIYYLTPERFRSYVVLGGSLLFYGWWRIDFIPLMLAVILWSYYIAKRIVVHRHTLAAKRWLTLGICLNIGTLAVFKYFNFGVDTVNAILHQSDLNSIEAIRFLLPIGISFYVFHAVSFLVDVYREDAPPRRLVDFAAFITLYPQLVAGPILRYKDLAGQFASRTHSMHKFSEGAYRFMIGFAKKVLIADTVEPLVKAVFNLSHPTFADAWLGALGYTVQLYFDFSGYSDMAVGLGLMIGFRLIENFNMPYISQSITEFWRRWHISLSTWLRDYLYIPLGGNRKGHAKTYRNLVLTMVLGGLWHGANWTFILWGVWHGGIMAIERALGYKTGDDIHRSRHIHLLSVVCCTFLVIIGWVMFRADNVSAAMRMYQAMFGMYGFGLSDAFSWQIKGIAVAAMVLGWILVYLQPWMRRTFHVRASEGQLAASQSIVVHLVVIMLFLLAVSRLLAQNYSPFLYFQF